MLGSILSNNKTYDQVSECLLPHHFADPINGKIYEAIGRRINAGRFVDGVSLKDEFTGTGVLGETGGPPYLAQLLAAMVSVNTAHEYGCAIHDAWLKRELADAAAELASVALAAGAATGHQVLETHEARLQHILDGAGDDAPVVWADAATREAAAKRGDALAGLSTGYAALDRLTLGLQLEQFVLLAARPSMGTTTLGLSIAARVATTGQSVLYWSGEMGASQLGARLVAAHADLPVESVFTGRVYNVGKEKAASRDLTTSEWHQLGLAHVAAAKLPLAFGTRPGITIQALRARARRIKWNRGLGFVVIDYIGLMRASPATEHQRLYERMTEISRDLLAMAMELKIPVPALRFDGRRVTREQD